jgi:rhamnosyltransferase subunit B
MADAVGLSPLPARRLHLLIVAIGSAGDVYPFLAVGRAALERGHRVSVCTSPAYQTLVLRSGLAFLPIGTAQDHADAMRDPALWHPRTSLRTLWRAVAPTLVPVYELLACEVDPDAVVLGSLWAFSARVLQERLGVTYLSAQVSPSTLLSAVAPPVHARFTLPGWWPLWWRRLVLRLIEQTVLDPLMAPAVNDLRRSVGLAPVRRLMSRWMHAPDGVLALFPAWFAPPQADWPQPLWCAGFPMFEEPDGTPLDAALTDFIAGGSPPIVITAGSTLLRDGSFFAAALGAVQALGRRAVLLGGDPALLPALPPGAIHRSFVPMAALLARSEALIHHGGIGTTALAMAAGVPQLVLPFAHDQFDNAARVQHLGCGLRLATRPLPSPAEFAARLGQLLTSEAVRTVCLGLKHRMVEDAGSVACRRILQAIEDCASRRRPQQARPVPNPASPPTISGAAQ